MIHTLVLMSELSNCKWCGPGASASPAAAAVAASLHNASLATAKHHASEGQTVKRKASSPLAMLVKDGTAYKNVLLRGLTSLLVPGENKASSAAKSCWY